MLADVKRWRQWTSHFLKLFFMAVVPSDLDDPRRDPRNSASLLLRMTGICVELCAKQAWVQTVSSVSSVVPCRDKASRSVAVTVTSGLTDHFCCSPASREIIQSCARLCSALLCVYPLRAKTGCTESTRSSKQALRLTSVSHRQKVRIPARCTSFSSHPLFVTAFPFSQIARKEDAQEHLQSAGSTTTQAEQRWNSHALLEVLGHRPPISRRKAPTSRP